MTTRRQIIEMMVVRLGAKWPSEDVPFICRANFPRHGMITPWLLDHEVHSIERIEFDQCCSELQGKSQFHKKNGVWLGCVNVPPVGSQCEYVGEVDRAGMMVTITGHEYNTEDCNWYCHYQWGSSKIHDIARWDRFRPHKDVRDYNLQPKV